MSLVALPKTSPVDLKEKHKTKHKHRQSHSIKVFALKKLSGEVWKDEWTGGWLV